MTVHFVGAGPGAADLLTVRAVPMLAACDVCVYAGTYVDDAVLAHCRAGARLVDTQHLDLDADHRPRSSARTAPGSTSYASARATRRSTPR